MSPTPASINTPFDRLSFLKYVKNIGRPYRKRGVELISISRTFARAQKLDQSFRTYDDLRSVLQVVDDALRSATKARKKTLKDADEDFKKAIDALSAYETRHHPNLETSVAKRMKSAEEVDTSSLKFLNKLKESRRPLVNGPTMTVEFILHESLLDKSPTTVKQELSQISDVKEILWNFSRRRPTGKDSDDMKRLSLSQHPHFYLKLPKKYWGGFRRDPTESFYHDQISVLTDNSGHAGRVFFEIPKRKRFFSKVWDVRDTIIFKDIFGKLEGESIVGSVIKDTPNLWCFEEPPRSRSQPSQQLFSSQISTSSEPITLNYNLLPAIPPTPTTSPTGELVGDWKEPIRRLMRSPLDMNIRVSPILPAESSPNYPPAQDKTFPSPTPPLDTNPVVDNPPIDSSQSLRIQIPEPSTRSSTPLSYETARSKPLPPVAGPSSTPSTPLSPETPRVSPSHLTPTQAPRTAVPLPMPRPLPRPLPPLPLPPSSFPSPIPPPPPPRSFPPPISLPPSGQAFPTQTEYYLPGTSSRAEFPENGGHPSQPPGAPVTRNAAITWNDVSTRKPHLGGSHNAGDSVGDLPSQSTDPEDEDEDLSDDAYTITPTPRARKRKKRKWYQRVIDRMLRRRSSEQFNASMPNLHSYGVSQRSS